MDITTISKEDEKDITKLAILGPNCKKNIFDKK